MKLNKFLIPVSIISLASASVSLIGCGGGDEPTPEKVRFSSTKGSMSSYKQGTFQISWTPSDHSLVFGTLWSFSCAYGSTTNITVDESSPKSITLNFANDVTKSIIDGSLSFTYDDLTTKESNIPVTISNIHLFRYMPPEPTVPSEITTYIQDRTFSLMAFPVVTDGYTEYFGGYFCYGTGWIIDDATPDNNTDYKYHVATNWHVIDGFNTVSHHDFHPYTYVDTMYAYADATSCKDPSGIIDSIKEYTFLGYKSDSNYVEEPDKTTFMYTPIADKKGIDLYEATINFACSQQGTVPSDAIKAKLDKLNAFRKAKHFINQFVKGNDPSIISKTKYVGGYPFKEIGEDEERIFGGKWECHQVVSDLQYIDETDHQHEVGETIDIKDYSSQYESDLDMPEDWMSGGASGSILLTEDCEICGIYWGGWSIIGEDEFYPAFSIFNKDDKNFLAKYIHS